MNNLLQLIENNAMRLEDGSHVIDGTRVIFINGLPYKEVICKDDSGKVLFTTNYINSYNYNFITLTKCMKPHQDNNVNKCRYCFKTTIKDIDLYYNVYLEFVPFRHYDANDDRFGGEFFSNLISIVYNIVEKHNIDNWNDNDDDDEWI